MLKQLGYYHIIWQKNDATYWVELKKSFSNLIVLKKQHYLGLDLSVCLKTLQVFQKNKKCSYRGAVFCLPDEQLIKKTLQLSKELTKFEIGQVVKVHCKEYYKNPSQYQVAFEILSASPQDEKYTVCCIAAPRSLIYDIQKKFKEWNIKLIAIDVASLVMARLGVGFA